MTYLSYAALLETRNWKLETDAPPPPPSSQNIENKGPPQENPRKILHSAGLQAKS
jgi:hypothetical protein